VALVEGATLEFKLTDMSDNQDQQILEAEEVVLRGTQIKIRKKVEMAVLEL
tara:strand:- start:81 stop:233 length:153 start_codon:yes stop_codon:yes gene_type:complete